MEWFQISTMTAPRSRTFLSIFACVLIVNTFGNSLEDDHHQGDKSSQSGRLRHRRASYRLDNNYSPDYPDEVTTQRIYLNIFLLSLVALVQIMIIIWLCCCRANNPQAEGHLAMAGGRGPYIYAV